MVVFSEHLEETVAFYETLGVPLHSEDHGDGNMHAAGDLGAVHIAVLPASAPGGRLGWRQAGSSFVGFYVTSLEETIATLALLGTEVLRTHEQCEWGCRVVVADPDGRAVEVNQRGHCPLPIEG